MPPALVGLSSSMHMFMNRKVYSDCLATSYRWNRAVAARSVARSLLSWFSADAADERLGAACGSTGGGRPGGGGSPQAPSRERASRSRDVFRIVASCGVGDLVPRVAQH